MVGDHRVERACFAQRAHGTLVDTRAPDEIGNVDERTIGQGLLELFTRCRAKPAHQPQAKSDDGDIVTGDS